MAGKQKPNLGRYNDVPEWTEILTYFRGSELQNYFTKILEDDLKAVIKPQYVDQIPRAVKGSVQTLIDKKDEMNNQDAVCEILDLMRVKDRNVEDLSGTVCERNLGPAPQIFKRRHFQLIHIFIKVFKSNDPI